MIPIRACASFAAGAASAMHDLARRFHAGDAAAIDAVADLVLEAVRGGATGPPTSRPAAVVVVPGHDPGSVNEPCRVLALRLAGPLGWPPPTDGALERIALAPEAHRDAHRNAPRSVDAEAATLRWHPGALPPTGTVLLLDDVVRTGATLAAAVRAAPDDLGTRLAALAVFLAQDAS